MLGMWSGLQCAVKGMGHDCKVEGVNSIQARLQGLGYGWQARNVLSLGFSGTMEHACYSKKWQREKKDMFMS